MPHPAYKTYDSYHTAAGGTLADYIASGTPADTLYVAHHVMCLRSGEMAHLFYNPKFYWCSLPWVELPEHVIEGCTTTCAVFARIQEQLASDAAPHTAVYDGSASFPGVGDEVMGNHYCVHGSHVYTYAGWLAHQGTLTRGIEGVKPMRYFSLDDLRWVMASFVGVVTRTPNVVRVVGELYVGRARS